MNRAGTVVLDPGSNLLQIDLIDQFDMSRIVNEAEAFSALLS